MEPEELLHNPLPEIPEEIFIEKIPLTLPPLPITTQKQKQNIPTKMDQSSQKPDIQYLFQYLETDNTKKGYEDALKNPDRSNLEENIQILKNNLNIVIAKVKVHYRKYISDLDFHIASRASLGMVDLAEEAESAKKVAIQENDEVLQIEKDAENQKGLTASLFITYRNGFRSGISEITLGVIDNLN